MRAALGKDPDSTDIRTHEEANGDVGALVKNTSQNSGTTNGRHLRDRREEYLSHADRYDRLRRRIVIESIGNSLYLGRKLNTNAGGSLKLCKVAREQHGLTGHS